MAKLLFLDAFHLASLSGLTLVTHQPIKDTRNPILTPTQPWEGWRAFPMANCIMRDPGDGLFKLWYETGYDETIPGDRLNRTAYATSSDGLHWERPNLGQTLIHGSTDNSVLNVGPLGIHNANVIRDERDPDPQRRYKMSFFGVPRARMRNDIPIGTTVATSPNGQHWTLARPIHDPAFRFGLDGRPGRVAAGDTHSLVGWIPEQQRYVALVRRWGLVPNSLRTICYSESEDFLNWSPPVNIFSPDERDPWGTEFYLLTVRQFGDVYLGLLTLFYNLSQRTNASGPPTATPPPELAHLDQRLEIHLAYSRDLQVWRRLGARQPFIGMSEPGAWDSGMMFGSALLEMGDEVWAYYGGTPMRHITDDLQYAGHMRDGRRLTIAGGVARLRRDGFASVRAGETPGEAITKPLALAGVAPTLNARTTPDGMVQVQWLDEASQPLEGAPLTTFQGDAIAAPLNLSPSWLERLNGTNIRLRLVLRQADLFAVTI